MGGYIRKEPPLSSCGLTRMEPPQSHLARSQAAAWHYAGVQNRRKFSALHSIYSVCVCVRERDRERERERDRLFEEERL